ncbi:hypothetical protein AB1N83_013997, partial [Pleurotus pulmonarius]
MLGEAGAIDLTIVVLKATGLTSKSTFGIRSKPSGYVAIKWLLGARNKVHKTRVIEEMECPIWEERFRLSSQSKDSIVSFEMFDKGLVLSHSYSTVQKAVSDLLADPKQDITFPSNGPVLSIMVEEVKDKHLAASEALDAAQEAINKLPQQPDQPEITTSCYAPLGEVVASLETFMNIADTLTEIHPYVKVAWSVVSVVYAVVNNQLGRNNAVHELLETMAALYDDSVLLKVAQKELSDNVVKTFKQILQQTIECSLFIQEYSGKGFARQAIASSLSTT